MGKLIKVEDAMICCRGNSAQLLKDARRNFQGLAAEYLKEATKAGQAGAPQGAVVQFLVSSLARVVIQEAELAAFARNLGLTVGASALQGLEWEPPELQVKYHPANLEYGALTLEQADEVYNQAAQQALAEHANRVRRCTAERALPQDSKAHYFRGSTRTRSSSRIGGFTAGLWRVIKGFVRRR